MNSLENYKSLIEKYFGPGAASFDANKSISNNVIGALNNTQFEPFRLAFHKRVERLSSRYIGNLNLPHLLLAMNGVGSDRNWEGAYAELVALDFLNADTDWLNEPISLSRTVSASETLASNLGMTNVNFDGYYDDFEVCFDVKILSDKTGDILDGIILQVKKTLGISNATISPEYPLDIDFELFSQNRDALYKELKGAIDKEKTTHFRSTIMPELCYRVLWGSGVLTTVSTCDPFQHAANHHKLLFGHAKKFSKTSPSLIVFVVFPWFSESLSFNEEENDVFYRAFCRRFFCQYAKDERKAKDVLRGVQGEIAMAEVTSKLSGVLFLEDRSIMAANPNEQNIKSFAYLNPNASHKVSKLFREHLHNRGFWIDDFENDNY